MLVRRAMIEDIGPIPTRYFLHYDDVEWCLRAQASGWRTMIHRQARMSLRKRSRARLPAAPDVYYLSRNRCLFARDSLGVDEQVALAALDRELVAPWREAVAVATPEWIESFEELVRMAKDDVRAGVDGRNDKVSDLLSGRPRG